MNTNHFIPKKDRAIELLQEGIDHFEEAYNLFTDIEDSMSFNTDRFMDKLDALLNQITILTGKETDKKLYSQLEEDLGLVEKGEHEEEEEEDDDDLTSDEDDE
uniref:Uncharacterized protein n=1 Tax=viral metagenome TaxID=1070528 RepID=A0A6H1ZXV6_9ZZZZ